MIKNLRWTFLSQFSTATFSLVIGIIMMRYIPPEDYGLIAMIIPAISFITIFNSFAVSSSIVSKIDISDNELSSLFWTRLLISIILAILLVASSPIIISFYNEPRLILIIYCYAIILIINSLNYVYNGFYKKRLNFKSLAKAEIISVSISGLIGLYLATQSFGYKSVLAKDLILAFLILLFSLYNIRWFPSFTFNLNSLKYHFVFGMNVTLIGILNFFSRSLDDILIGKKFGSQALGLYSKGYSLLVLPLNLVSKSFTSVLLPYIAKEQNQLNNASQIYLKAMRGVLGINTPMCIFMFFVCSDLVEFFLGDQWLGIIPFLQVFAILSIFQSVGPLNDLVYEGLNKTDKLLKYNFIVQCITIASILLGYFIGDSAFDIAIYYASGNFLTFFINQFFVSKTLEIKQKTTYLNMSPFLLSGAISFLVGWLVMTLNWGEDVHFILAVLKCLGYILLFYLVLFILDKDKYLELYNNFKSSIHP
jgi:O-antigen/teichoic acid export membrane protein